MEEQELIEKEKEVRDRAFYEALLAEQSEKDEREKKESKRKKELRDIEFSFNKSSKALDDELRKFKEELDSEAVVRNKVPMFKIGSVG